MIRGSISKDSYRAVRIAAQLNQCLRRRRVSAYGVGQRLLEQAIARAPSLGVAALVGFIFGHNVPRSNYFNVLALNAGDFSLVSRSSMASSAISW